MNNLNSWGGTLAYHRQQAEFKLLASVLTSLDLLWFRSQPLAERMNREAQ